MNPTIELINLIKQTEKLRGKVNKIEGGLLYIATQQSLKMVPGYAKVFGGAGWILFKKPPSKVEIINDLNHDLITLYRVVKHHTREFIHCLRGLPMAREEFNRFLKQEPHHLTDIQRTVRWYYLIRTCYGSRFYKPTFSVSANKPSNFNPLVIKRDLLAAQKRLARVLLENMDFTDFIPRYDSDRTFFYLDPPYYSCENYYRDGIFTTSDFTKLHALLASIKGKFCLSINDVPKIRSLFGEFNTQPVHTSYSLSGADRKKKVTELLIMNY